MSSALTKRRDEIQKQNNDMKKMKIINDTPSVGKGRLKKFVRPPPRRKQASTTASEAKHIETLTELKEKKDRDEEASKEEFFECPSCAAQVKPPYPRSLQLAMDDLNQQKLNYEQSMRVAYAQQVEQRKKEEGDDTHIMPFMLQPFVIQDALKRKICHIHKLEYELKPLGKERGYPEFIDFEVLPKRVKEVCQKDLDQIISRKLESDYLERALARFKELGEKARRPEYAIEQFQDYLPGYYGHKGSEVILDVLNELYLQTGKVKHSSFKPLTAIEVLQQVLVPECGLRLIQQDYNEKNKNISLEEARKIMRGSTEFGNLMYPKEEDEIESDRKGILSNNDEHDSKYDGKEEYE